MSDRGWQEHAECSSGRYDPDLWFPEQHDTLSASTAKRICGWCPVREECAEYAVNFPVVLNGVWGGMSRREIRAERVRRGIRVQSEAAFSGLPRNAEN